MDSKNIVLNVNGIEVIYNHVILVLKGVSLNVPEGKIAAILGGNGAGKTTTLRAISNLLKGEIAANLEKVYNYFPRLKTRRTSQAAYTSGGEQQMCAIGRALMANPSMVLLDEPSMGLAPQIVEEVFNIVKDLNTKEKVTFLLAEQNTNMALKYADYGYIMESGRVVMDGAASDLASNEDVKEFYLGMGGGERKSFKDVKSYKRRKRWLA